MPLHRHRSRRSGADRLVIQPQAALLAEIRDIPRFRLADTGLPPDTAYQIVHDELLLDGNARLNLATFVTTWMERQAEELMAESSAKNMIDKDEYPQTAELEGRCVHMLADLWNASAHEDPTGCSTAGSSEGCMLGGLALKRRWCARREAAGAPAQRPNLVMGANVQVCWEKFCRYWDVEARLVPVGPTATHLTGQSALAYCDERTIGVVAILGSTYDGAYEPVSGIASALDTLAAEEGIDIPIHVDAASGGFVAPFLDPDLAWDFRLPRVASINASGHKYGLVYPGIGWVVWRDHSALPEDLVFQVDYLGGQMPTFSLNFSRPGAQVAAQYYHFLRLGFDGYRVVQQSCRDIARWLADQIAALGPFTMLSHGDGIPALAFRLHDGVPYTVFDISEALRTRGWLVPAYRMPPDLQDVAVLRIVVRNGFGWDLAYSLIDDLRRATDRLGAAPAAPDTPEAGHTAFHH
jgi:glutamate decarboxylase